MKQLVIVTGDCNKNCREISLYSSYNGEYLFLKGRIR